MIRQTPVQLPLGVQLQAYARLASYIAGTNAEITAACRDLAEQCNGQIYLWGPPGVGKSHLLQGVCRAVSDAGRRAAYLPLQELCEAAPDVLAGMESLDVVCLDALDAIAGTQSWEEALVGLIDSLRQRRAGLLMAAPAAPGELDLRLRDLSSRLGWGAVYGLSELGDEDKQRLLMERAGERGLYMPLKVSRFLLNRSERDLPSLLATLDRLDRASLAAQRRLTVPFVKQVLDV